MVVGHAHQTFAFHGRYQTDGRLNTIVHQNERLVGTAGGCAKAVRHFVADLALLAVVASPERY